MKQRIAGGGLLILLSGACSVDEGSSDSDVDLIVFEGWEPVEEAEDPFFGHDFTAASVVCDAQSWKSEGESTEINTTTCNYLTLTQPTTETIQKGDRLELNVWWQTLASEGPALGHIAVSIGEHALLDEEIPLPANADARNTEWTSVADIPVGTPIFFHVHNHGFNSWTLGSLTLQH